MIHIKHNLSVSELKNLISDLAKSGHPSIDRAAASLSMSPRSLQRVLKHQGKTYSDLVDDTRFKTARCLMSDPTLSITDIAARLGYRDPSSFSRAFMRWAACSPRHYRAAMRAGDGSEKQSPKD